MVHCFMGVGWWSADYLYYFARLYLLELLSQETGQADEIVGLKSLVRNKLN